MAEIKKALVIFNPNAGVNVKQDVEKLVREKLSLLSLEAEVFYLNKKFEENISGYDFSDVILIVAVGGDGTVKVAARTIIANKLRATLAIIPFGSANILANALNIPTSISQSLKLLGQYQTEKFKIDAGLVNHEHYFFVGISAGYISNIVSSTSRDLKNKYGNFGYLLRFAFNKIKIKKLKFEVVTRNKIFWVKGNSLVIFNVLSYLWLRPKKNVNFSDGLLNLYVFTNKTFLTLIQAFLYLVWYHQPPRHVFTLDNNYFKIILKRPINSWQIDGDYLKLGREIEVEILPLAVEIVSPLKRQ